MIHFLKAVIPVMMKEFLHIRRDARTLAILFVVPTGLMMLVGFVVNFDVNNVKMAVLDEDHSAQSRTFTQSFFNSHYFVYTAVAHDEQELDEMLADGKIAVALIVPTTFSQLLAEGKTADVQVLIDGSNFTTAPIVLSYVSAAVSTYSTEIRTIALRKMGRQMTVPVDFRPRIWFNPELSSVRFLIPGLIGYVLMLTSVVATAMSIVREKERGTMEQLVVSSLKPVELITGKLLPYLLIALVATVLLLLASFFVFGVAVSGSMWSLFVSVFLFLICALAMGLWVSSISRTQTLAFTLATLVSTLPSMMLSGFIYPIRSMPFPIQLATNLTPARFFIQAIRAIMLKGVGVEMFWQDWMAMAIFSTVLISISANSLRKQKL